MGTTGRESAIEATEAFNKAFKDSVGEGASVVRWDSLKELDSRPPFVGIVSFDVGGATGQMFLNGKDDSIAFRLLWAEEYEPLTSNIWKSLCAHSDVAVDIGAHTGYFSLLAASVNPRISHVIVEPNPLVLPRLIANMKRNNLANTTLFHCAVGAKKKIVRFNHPTAASYLSTGGHVADSPTQGLTFPVQQMGLDSIVEGINCERAVIKIDTEGHEQEIFENSKYGREFYACVFECLDLVTVNAIVDQNFDHSSVFLIQENKKTLKPLSNVSDIGDGVTDRNWLALSAPAKKKLSHFLPNA